MHSKKAEPSLAELRAAAYGAVAAHESDMKTDTKYKAFVDRKTALNEAKALNAGQGGSHPIRAQRRPTKQD
jgi:hypothetical protein